MKARRFRKLSQNQVLIDSVYSLVAIAFALLLGALTMFLFGYDVSRAMGSFYQGVLGNSYNLSQTFLRSIPLMFTGLAVAIGFQAGLFNIGGEGQLYWGAFATAVFSLTFPQLPPVLMIPLALLAGFLAGALWGSVPGFLKAKTGAHEVITTIMLNYVATLLTTLLLVSYFKAPGPVDQTLRIPDAARLPEIVEFTRLTWAIAVGAISIVLADLLLRKTALGYDLVAVGQNQRAAEYAGIQANRMTVIALALSGGIAGLAGSTIVMGVLHRFITNFSPGYGFTGIAVAILGRNNPWGVLLAALLFGALEQGGASMQLTARIPADLMTFVQGLVILFVAAPAVFGFLRLDRQNEEAQP